MAVVSSGRAGSIKCVCQGELPVFPEQICTSIPDSINIGQFFVFSVFIKLLHW